MRRLRLAFSVLVLGGCFTAVAAEALQTAKVPRVGCLGDSRVAARHLEDAFLGGLRDLGYVEGRGVVIERRYAEGKPERFPALAAELVALEVDVIVAFGGIGPALAAKQTTSTLPIVFVSVSDPVGSGLVKSLARPGGNATGLSNVAPELVGKGLELLKQTVPGVRRIAGLRAPGQVDQRTAIDTVREAEAAGRALGMQFHLVEVRQPADLDRAFSDMKKAGAGALTVLPSLMLFNERDRLAGLAARHRMPAVYRVKEFVEAGGLMSYGPDLTDLFRRAASYVDKILRGAKPTDLPVEQPTKFELVINLKAARTLGLTIPPSVLARADQVVDK